MANERTIRIDRTGPNKAGDQYVVIISALLQFERKPVKNHPVQFYLDWVAFPAENSPMPTKEDGRALIQIPVSEGNHTVAFKVVRLDGSEEWRSESFRVGEPKAEKKDPEPRTPTKIYVTFTGVRGSYRFLVSASDAQGLIPGLVIPVVDGTNITTCETELDGTAIYDAHFNEPDRYFEFRVGNEHDTIWRNRLPGPKQSNQLTLV